ncbi:BatD family protein [Chitinophagaceae bacterium MMS25-I14]
MRLFLLCLPLLLGYTAAQAQEIVFTATASAQKMGVQDQIQVTYTIQNMQKPAKFVPPVFKDFAVAGGPQQMQSSNATIVNNQMVQTVSFSIIYVVQPRHTGMLTIPAATINDNDGHVYQSNTVNIRVVDGSLASQQQQRQRDPFDDPMFQDPFAQLRQMQQQMLGARGGAQRPQQQPQQQPQATSAADIGKDLFIKVQVDKDKVHIGEQVTASYKLYARIPMQMQISKLPSLNGFWTQDFQLPKEAKPVEEIVNGKKYQVFTLKKSALFPQQAGSLTLDPAEAQGTARIIQKVRQRNPFADMFDDPMFRQAFGGSLMMNDPMFNNGFFDQLGYQDIPVHLKSTPVKITVTPLPEKDKPEGYGNAVGNFAISSKIDKTDVTTDDAVTFTVNITGSGNLKLIEAPVLKLPNGLDSYDPQIIDTITGRTTTISGSKIITYPIAPHTPGDYEIPAIPFSYFNPQSGTYVTLHTQPVHIHVKPGKHYNPAVAQNKAITDLHPIATQPLKNLSFNSRPILFTVGYWSMYALPFFGFIGLLVWKRRDEELSRDVVKLKNRKANKIALKRLATAQKLLQAQKHQAFYEEVSKAIWLYLSDKLNIPLSALSKETATEALTRKDIPASLQQELSFIIDDCETALYAPGGSQKMNETYQKAIDVISKLEENFK